VELERKGLPRKRTEVDGLVLIMGKPLEGSSGLEAIGKPSKTLLEDTLASQSKIFLSQLGTLRGYLEKAGNDKVNGDAEAEKVCHHRDKV
jgi:hypothetical protein